MIPKLMLAGKSHRKSYPDTYRLLLLSSLNPAWSLITKIVSMYYVLSFLMPQPFSKQIVFCLNNGFEDQLLLLPTYQPVTSRGRCEAPEIIGPKFWPLIFFAQRSEAISGSPAAYRLWAAGVRKSCWLFTLSLLLEQFSLPALIASGDIKGFFEAK